MARLVLPGKRLDENINTIDGDRAFGQAVCGTPGSSEHNEAHRTGSCDRCGIATMNRSRPAGEKDNVLHIPSHLLETALDNTVGLESQPSDSTNNYDTVIGLFIKCMEDLWQRLDVSTNRGGSAHDCWRTYSKGGLISISTRT